MRSLACLPDTMPSVVSCLAMKVMARVLTTPYTSQTISQAQWRFHKLVWRSTKAQPRLICRRVVNRLAGGATPGTVVSAIDGHLHLFLVVVHGAAGELHEHVFHVDA